jgi:hypothetical protein
MKQLYYTSCVAGKSVGGGSGFQVRAASAGIGPDRARAVVGIAGYALPAGFPSSSAPEDAPVRLAFLDVPGAGRVLCHGCYAGKDTTTGRYGNFFSHAVFDLPEGFDARAAIATWDGPSWRRTDGDYDTELPDLANLAPAGKVDDAALTRFLATESGRRLGQFVLGAWLTARSGDRIFLAAPPAAVASCLHALARMLPRGMVRELTFSTYESAPLGCSARVVGTCFAAADDLPSSCYDGAGWGCNSSTGRSTPLPPPGPFVAFALEAALWGRWAELDAFLDLCRRLDVDDPRLLDLLLRQEQRRDLPNGEELRRAAGAPKLAAWLVENPAVARLVVAGAVEGPADGVEVLRQFVATTRGRGTGGSHLLQMVREQGTKVLRSGAPGQVRKFFEGALAALPPAETRAAERALLDGVADPAALSSDVRGYLLTRLAVDTPPRDGPLEQRIRRWLIVASPELGPFLRSGLPEAFHVAGCLACLETERRVSEEFSREVSRRPELAIPILHHLGQRAESNPGAVQVFRALARRGDPTELTCGLLSAAVLPPPLLAACLEEALHCESMDVARLIESCGDALRGRSELLAPVVRWFLDRPLGPAWQEAGALDLLEHAARPLPPSAPEETSLRSLLTVAAFLEAPVLAVEKLQDILKAVQQQPPATRCGLEAQVWRAVCRALLSQPRRSDPQPAVEAVLGVFGSAAGDTPGTALRLVRDLAQDRRLPRHPGLLRALLGTCFGVVASPELREALAAADDRQRQALEDEAWNLACLAAARGPRRLLEEVSRAASGWPAAVQERWAGFLEHLPQRPRFGCAQLVFPSMLVLLAVAAGTLYVLLH